MQEKLAKLLSVVQAVTSGCYDVDWPSADSGETDDAVDRVARAVVELARALHAQTPTSHEEAADDAIAEGQARLDSVAAMASSVAHEINNPLSYVVVNLEHLQRMLSDQRIAPSPTREEMELAVEEAQDGVRRVAQIVRDLQVFSAGDGDAPQVDITMVLDSVLRLMGNEIRHRARLVREYAQVPAVQGNAARLGQVFLSLLQNAVQALPEGNASDNTVRIAVQLADPATVQVVLSDSGRGVPTHLAERIFEPQFSTRGASGLGLPVARAVLSSVGGHIRLVPTQGRGATFKVSLRVANLGARATPTASVVQGERPHARILVVDDEPLVVRAIKRCLPEYEITTASDGREAVALLSSHPFDLIFCDLMMPDMGGMDLHAYLLKEHPDMVERMVIVTGGAFSAQGRRFLELSRLPVLEKPFNREKLRTKVSGMLERLGRTESTPTDLDAPRQ